jgi:poly(hydroxyalkanoate) depolymerase family esterase
MRGLGRLTADLARHRRRWEGLFSSTEGLRGDAPTAGMDRLSETTGFGSNPGNLRMLTYLPQALAGSPALVVVLHGCSQTAAGYDHGTGWSTLADRYGFAVLFPEQQRANNPKTCFSWFQPGDTARGQGEALSIRQMVEHMVRAHGIDRSRVYVTGLSAGGAMAAALLAAYPEVFAGGAIIAGLPAGAATNVHEAFETMFNGRTRPAREWGDLVRAASPHRGPWPRVSIWHGSADKTVTPMNAQELVKQWTDVHGLSRTEAETGKVDGYPRRVWRDPSGEALVEEYTITGMAHGAPLAPSAAEHPHGAPGPFLLDVGIASSYHIAAFWGLTRSAAAPKHSRTEAAPRVFPKESARLAAARRAAPEAAVPRDLDRRPAARLSSFASDIGAVITKALRSAGLMRR